VSAGGTHPLQAAGTRYLTARGCTVRYQVRGDGDIADRAPLLLLNGLTRPLESWQAFLDAMPDRTVVMLDAPGVGGSAPPLLPPGMPTLAALAVDVLDAIGSERADVLGFSHGGAVAQQLVAQSPHRVRGLVLAATSCGVGGVLGSQSVDVVARKPVVAHGWPAATTLGTIWNAVALSQWSSIPFIGAITTPTLVVTGARDRVVPPSNSTLLARRIPGASLVQLAAGHDLQRAGTAGLLAATVRRFLADLPRDSPGNRPVTADGAGAGVPSHP
jgi:pimeloyl-ACP methyl ester carboxylesterase